MLVLVVARGEEGCMDEGERRSNERTTGQTTRRRVVRGAAVAGALAAAAYVKPGLRSLGVPGALASVSGAPIAGPYDGPPGRDPDRRPGKPD